MLRIKMAVFYVLLVICSLFLLVAAEDPLHQLNIGAIFSEQEQDVMSLVSHKMATVKTAEETHLTLQPQMNFIDDPFSISKEVCSLFADQVLALVGSHTSLTYDAIRSLTDRFHVPFVTTGMAREATREEKSYQVFLRPQYSRALVEIFRANRWRKIHYVYKDEEGFQRLMQLLDILTLGSQGQGQGEELPVATHPVRDAADVFNLLEHLDLKASEDKKLVLDLPTDDIHKLLEMIKGKELNRGFHFVLASLDIMDLDWKALLHRGDRLNITGVAFNQHSDILQQFTQDDTNNSITPTPFTSGQLLALDAASVIEKALWNLLKKSPDIAKRSMEANHTDGPVDCFGQSLVPWIGGPDLMAEVKQVDFAGVTGHVMFDGSGQRIQYELDVIHVTNQLGPKKVGVWHSGTGLSLEAARSEAQTLTRGNERAASPVIVTSILTAPYLMMKEDRSAHGNDRYEGYCADLIHKVCSVVGIDCQIQPVKDGSYGAVDDNGTWTGMIGELIRNEAEMAIAPLTITARRGRVVDFSKPYMSVGLSMMALKPQTQLAGPSSHFFLSPFSAEVWFCSLAALLAVSVFMFIIKRFSPFEQQVQKKDGEGSASTSGTILTSFWFTLGGINGTKMEPRSVSGRLLTSTWWCFILVLVCCYTANLAALMLAPRAAVAAVDTVQDLAEQTTIRYGTVRSGSSYEFFKTSTIGVYGRMWSFMSNHKDVLVSSNEEGIEKVRNSGGRYIFFLSSSTNDYINQRRPCNTMKIGGNLNSAGYGIATPLGSALRERVNLAILELRENGELHKLHKKWWFDKGQCAQQKADTEPRTHSQFVKLDDMMVLGYVMVAGLLLAVITAVLEFTYKSVVDARKDKSSIANSMKKKGILCLKGKVDSAESTANELQCIEEAKPTNI